MLVADVLQCLQQDDRCCVGCAADVYHNSTQLTGVLSLQESATLSETSSADITACSKHQHACDCAGAATGTATRMREEQARVDSQGLRLAALRAAMAVGEAALAAAAEAAMLAQAGVSAPFDRLRQILSFSGLLAGYLPVCLMLWQICICSCWHFGCQTPWLPARYFMFSKTWLRACRMSW